VLHQDLASLRPALSSLVRFVRGFDYTILLDSRDDVVGIPQSIQDVSLGVQIKSTLSDMSYDSFSRNAHGFGRIFYLFIPISTQLRE